MKDILGNLIFALLITTALATWSKPVEIYNGSELYIQDVHTEAATGTKHLLLSEKGTYCSNVEYWQVDKNNKIIFRNQFKSNNTFRYFETKAIGIQNNASRLHLLVGTTKDLYKILFYSETFNGGKDWTPFKKISNTDICDRPLSNLLVIKETGRVFVFFAADCAEGYKYVRVITRPANSTVFSREFQIYNRNESDYPIISMVSEYTYNGNKLILHLFWTTYIAFYYSRSEDVGLTWTVPKKITGYYSMQNDMSLASNRAITSTIMGTYFEYYDKYMLFYTKDHGVNLTSIELKSVHSSGKTNYKSTVICGNKNSTHFYSMAKLEDGGTYYYHMDLNTTIGEFRENPFVGKNYLNPVLSCISYGNTIIVTSFATGKYDDIHRIFVAQDTIKLD